MQKGHKAILPRPPLKVYHMLTKLRIPLFLG